MVHDFLEHVGNLDRRCLSLTAKAPSRRVMTTDLRRQLLATSCRRSSVCPLRSFLMRFVHHTVGTLIEQLRKLIEFRRVSVKEARH